MQNRCNLRPIHPPTSQIKSPHLDGAFYLTEFSFAKALGKMSNSNKFINYILFEISFRVNLLGPSRYPMYSGEIYLEDISSKVDQLADCSVLSGR